jgi:septum formation protein
MAHLLYLASSSASRKYLLEQAHIPFVCVQQTADESECDHSLPLEKLVAAIAAYKMEHVIMPVGKYEGELAYVITADTLAQDADGTIQGKPLDRADAIQKIKSARDGSHISTGFCLEKKQWNGERWETVARHEEVVSATCRYVVPDQAIEYYLDNTQALSASGAIILEGFGQQFLETVNGSYSTIIGLPLAEVRSALQKFGFFK